MSDNVIFLVKTSLNDGVLPLRALKKNKQSVDFSQFTGARRQPDSYRQMLNEVPVMRRESQV